MIIKFQQKHRQDYSGIIGAAQALAILIPLAFILVQAFYSITQL